MSTLVRLKEIPLSDEERGKAVCAGCWRSARFRRIFFVEDYTWHLFLCDDMNCKRIDHLVFTKQDECVRCQFPTQDTLCYMCKKEIAGESPSSLSPDVFLTHLIAMFESGVRAINQVKAEQRTRQPVKPSWVDQL